jgi:hypothetical protein
MVLAHDGDPAVGDTLLAAAKLAKVIEYETPLPFVTRLMPALQYVLSRARPDAVVLGRLAGALAALDHDDVIRRMLLQRRVQAIQESGLSPFAGRRSTWQSAIDRPWRMRRLNGLLAWFAQMLEGADAPWPERIDLAARFPPGIRGPVRPALRERPALLTESRVDHLGPLRAARTAVAIERFRRDHAEQLPSGLQDLVPAYLPAIPIDPFSGQPLRFMSNGSGYVVYGVGKDRRDDGGDIVIRRVSPTAFGSPDSGIRIRYN